MNKSEKTVRENPILRKLFVTKDDEVVFGQAPNKPLLGAILFAALHFILIHIWPQVPLIISAGFFFYWAGLEIYSGVNLFRRIMGLVTVITVLVYLIYFFK